MQATRVVFTICLKAFLDGGLGREATRERDRERVLAKLARDLRSDSRQQTRMGKTRAWRGGEKLRCTILHQAGPLTKSFTQSS
jgi:hypothetical protein